MKKLFLLFAILAMSVSLNAAAVYVLLADGTTLKGRVISHDESSLVVEPNTFVKYKKTLSPQDVLYFVIDGEGRFDSKDGKFVLVESLATTNVSNEPATSPVVAPVQENNMMAANPNAIIGKALKSTGAYCMGIGVPALVAGGVLTVMGYGGLLNPQAAAGCATAGCVLMPFGAALTVVGVPLYVKGQQIAQINVNYTGSGAGVVVSF